MLVANSVTRLKTGLRHAAQGAARARAIARDISASGISARSRIRRCSTASMWTGRTGRDRDRRAVTSRRGSFRPALERRGPAGRAHRRPLLAQVVKFIRENKDRPFYVNYWQFSVHAPYDAKDELVAKYRKLADPKQPAAQSGLRRDGREPGRRRRPRAGRLGRMRHRRQDHHRLLLRQRRRELAGPRRTAGHKSERFQADMTVAAHEQPAAAQRQGQPLRRRRARAVHRRLARRDQARHGRTTRSSRASTGCPRCSTWPACPCPAKREARWREPRPAAPGPHPAHGTLISRMDGCG